MGLNLLPLNRQLPPIRWIVLALLTALLAPSTSIRAQDPVEKLKQALTLPSSETDPNVELLVQRRKLIEASVAELNTISLMRRAYFLKEWLTIAEEKNKNFAVDKYRVEVGDRFIKTIIAGAKDPDPDVKIPIATLIAEMADAEQLLDRKGHGKFTRVFTKVAIDLAKDENILVRQHAISALGKITPNPGEVIPLLRQTLKTDALGPKRFAAYALSDLVKNAAFLKTLDDDKKIPGANEELQTIQLVVSAAADGIHDSDERVRGYSLQAIFESAKALADYIGSSSISQPILREEKGNRILDRDINAVLKAMQTVSPQVLDRFKDPQANVRLTALQALDQISVSRSKLARTLQDAIANKNITTVELFKSVNAADPLESVVTGDWKRIVALLKDDDVRLRRGVMDILEQLGERAEPAAEYVTQALSDPDRWVRWTAARTIRNFSQKSISSSAIRGLAAMLSDPDADISATAADVLKELGPHAAEAIDALALSVVEGDVENRLKAMSALIRIGGNAGERATPRLIDALSDPDVRIRREATETLGRFGSTARAALPALRAAMRDTDGTVRLNASEAILSIAPPRKKL